MIELQKYIGDKAMFPVLRHLQFFNHAGVAPITQTGAAAMARFVNELRQTVYIGAKWWDDIEKLRASAAKLMNATPEEIAFIKNTSEGLCTVAKGLDWKAGDRIVTTNVEYPANIYPWMDVAQRHGCELVMVPEETDANGRRQVPLEKILQEIDHPKTRLVTLSHVEFASGQRHDIAAIGARCRAQGKLFCVDAIQSLGVLPVDVQAMKIDFLSADGHKWLLGPEGAGVLYIRRELQDQVQPLVVGWMNVINAEKFGDYDYTLKPDARRYESGSFNVVGLLGLKGSLEFLASLRTEAIAQRLKVLTDRLIDGLVSKGYDIVSPRQDHQWSGIVAFISKTHDHETIFKDLRQQKTEIALREGRLRISPHFYNTEEQIDTLLERLPG